ncbi:MAG TPA: hypothetical protein VHX68_01510 [Planctomycetaceae bacterium]|jgi:Tol biopolymer transport system component|nr:hypothetical protein [Planctomycetaceae bacterium]
MLLVSGCDPVPEDRRLQFSPSGNQVAFQHGADGIFVADPQTGELRKVFDPDPSIVAVSTPLWSEDETRAVFTTARNANPPPTPENGATTKASPQASKTPSSTTSPAPNSSSQKSTVQSATTPPPPTPSPSVSLPAAFDDTPEGRYFLTAPIVYTCWSLTRAADGAFSKPAALFEARCDHSGYVAANIAVRWHPTQQKILFVDHDNSGGLAVWLFDVGTQRKTKLFPPAGQPAPTHVLADFLPGGNQIVCVATDASWTMAQPLGAQPAAKPPQSAAGIWVGAADGSNWWHIAESAPRDPHSAPRGLANLIDQRPAVARDGSRFAFLRNEIAKNGKPQATLFRVRVAEKKVDQLDTTAGQISDLHWSPDGTQLGFVVADPDPHLKILDRDGHPREALTDCFVRAFAGWNATGNKWAAVVAETPLSRLQNDTKPGWAFLLRSDPLARDAIIVETAGTRAPFLYGLRFTFPQWSTKRDQLSMWGTFSPSYRSMADLSGLTLRHGDPAALLDVTTGTVRWLAINGDEQAQVGHYFLRHHELAQARDWYRKADPQLPKLEPLKPADLMRGVSGAAARRRTFEFCYWYCLTRLNQPQEAATRLQNFDNAYHIDWPPLPKQPVAASPANTTAVNPSPANAGDAGNWSSPAARRQLETLVALSKALTIAQIFLSIDEPEGGLPWFIKRLDPVDSKQNPLDDAERLADLTTLSQLHLLRNENQAYATLATDRLAPLIFQMLEDPAAITSAPAIDGPTLIQTDLATLFAHALGPLFCESFLQDLPHDAVQQLAPKWQALRDRSHSKVATFYADLLLHAAAARLGQEKDRAAASERIAKNPVRSQLMLPEKLEPYFQSLRAPSVLNGNPQL